LIFRAAEELVIGDDGIYRFTGGESKKGKVPPKGWIFVFEVKSSSQRTPNPVEVTKVIQTDAETLADLAFRKAPLEAVNFLNSSDSLRTIIRRRIKEFWPGFRGS
jgi:hypothetical protein